MASAAPCSMRRGLPHRAGRALRSRATAAASLQEWTLHLDLAIPLDTRPHGYHVLPRRCVPPRRLSAYGSTISASLARLAASASRLSLTSAPTPLPRLQYDSLPYLGIAAFLQRAFPTSASSASAPRASPPAARFWCRAACGSSRVPHARARRHIHAGREPCAHSRCCAVSARSPSSPDVSRHTQCVDPHLRPALPEQFPSPPRASPPLSSRPSASPSPLTHTPNHKTWTERSSISHSPTARRAPTSSPCPPRRIAMSGRR
ncbi:hypothetical protein B0H14DRAFT_1274962 [Mycena olivaceomarginata]|nr:hypothetical protein B0H14DRAFT_1274962 [Mycena olivaceomarginata]